MTPAGRPAYLPSLPISTLLDLTQAPLTGRAPYKVCYLASLPQRGAMWFPFMAQWLPLMNHPLGAAVFVGLLQLGTLSFVLQAYLGDLAFFSIPPLDDEIVGYSEDNGFYNSSLPFLGFRKGFVCLRLRRRLEMALRQLSSSQQSFLR